MKRDIYELMDNFGNETKLTVPAGDKTNHLLTKGENQILSLQENIELSETERK